MTAPAADWMTEANIALIKAWWPDHSIATSEMARRLGISKNALVGKAHRLGLPSRPSPIRRDGVTRTPLPTVKRATGPTLQPLRSVQPEAKPKLVAIRAEQEPAGEPEVVYKPRRAGQCSYPLGDPKTPAFRYCDEPTPNGRTYCDEHHARCWVKRRPSHDAAPSDQARPQP